MNKLVRPKKHGDARGFFSETYVKRDMVAVGIDVDFVQDNHSLSAPAGTVRGLHFQTAPFAQDKLVRVTRGAVLDAVQDAREWPCHEHVARDLRGHVGGWLAADRALAAFTTWRTFNAKLRYGGDKVIVTGEGEGRQIGRAHV